MRLFQRIRPVTLVTALCLAPMIGAPAALADPPTDPVTIDLLNITDLHGHIAKGGDDPGAVTLACEVKAARQANANTLFLSTGDSVGGSPFASSILKDKPTLDVLNAIGLDASALGNHEFDAGLSDLTDRILPLAEFPYLGANVDGSAALDAEGDGKGYVIRDVGGAKVAIIGAVTADTPSMVAPSAVASLTFSDPLAAANDLAVALKDGQEANGEADVVVVLIHEDAASQASVIAPQVDAVFGGHTHLKYQQVVTVGGNDIGVVQAGHYGRDLARVSLTWDPTTGDVTVNRAVVDNLTASNCTEDAYDVAAIVDAATEASAVEGSRQVATIGSDFLRGTNTGADTGSNRGTESTASNMIAESFRQWAASSTPATDMPIVGLMNPGGVRADLLWARSGNEAEDGIVTFAEAYAVQNFSNEMAYATLTGADLKAVLSEQFQPTSRRPVLMLGTSSNVEVKLDQASADALRAIAGTTPAPPDADAQIAAARATLITQVLIDGVELEDTDVVRVASNSFLMEGGDGFLSLKNGTGYTNTGTIDVNATIEYLRSFGATPLVAEVTKNQVGWAFSDEGEDGVDFDLRVTGLVMSATAEQKGAAVVLATQDVEIARADIDKTPVALWPETGTVLFEDIDIPATVAPTVNGGSATGFAHQVTVDVVDSSGALVQRFLQDVPVPAPAARAAVAGADSVEQGQEITFVAEGFAANEELTVTVHSDPLRIGTAMTDRAGKASVTWPVPPDFAAGDHMMVFSSADGVREASAAFKVRAAAVMPAEPDPAQPGVPSGGTSSGRGGKGFLASTGASSTAWIAAMTLALAGGALYLQRRKGARGN